MFQEDRALGDIKVLDCSQGVSGPFCAKLLAGLGAEVIRIEGTGGTGEDDTLTATSSGGSGKSASYQYLNAGKKSITLNLADRQGAEILRRLAQDSDILIESFPAGYMDRLGLGYSALEGLNSGLIYTSITPFGQDGPYRDYKGSDIVAQAIGALMHAVGLPDREPLKIGGNAALYTIGMSAFSATMLALYVRDFQGYGQHVDVSDMETIAVAQIHSSIHHQFGRTPVRRESTLVRAKDGWVNPGLETGVREDIWAQVCDLMGVPELADDPSFNTREARREHQQEVLDIFGKWAATRPKEEIYHTLQGLRTIAGYVATSEDLLKSEQLQARGFFQPIDDPAAGPESPESHVVMHPGAPFLIDSQPWHSSRAPEMGEHNSEILCDRLGYSEDDLERLRAMGVI